MVMPHDEKTTHAKSGETQSDEGLRAVADSKQFARSYCPTELGFGSVTPDSPSNKPQKSYRTVPRQSL